MIVLDISSFIQKHETAKKSHKSTDIVQTKKQKLFLARYEEQCAKHFLSLRNHVTNIDPNRGRRGVGGHLATIS